MSYCRWSSDFGQCDVYVYANVSGMWTTHVAGRRLRHIVPDEIKAMYPAMSDVDSGDWVDRYMAASEAESAWRDTIPSDEVPCKILQSDGTTKYGVFRWPKDSEYLDLSEVGPEAGESFDDATPGECADRLERLRAKGFLVPQRAIDALREEQAGMDADGVTDGDTGRRDE